MTELRRRPRDAAAVAGRRLGTRGARSGSGAARWLERWEPVPEPGSADPALDFEAFRARCAAWERQRHFDAAYGFGLFLARRPLRRRGQPRQRAARPVPDGLHRLLDRRGVRRQRVRPRRCRAPDPLRVRDAAPAPARSGDRAAQRAEPARRREARPARRRHRRAVPADPGRRTRITSATRSRARNGASAVTSSSRGS